VSYTRNRRIGYSLLLMAITFACSRVHVENFDGDLEVRIGRIVKLEKLTRDSKAINAGVFLANAQNYLYTDNTDLYSWKNQNGGALIFSSREISDMVQGEEFNHLYVASCTRGSIIALNLRGGGETELANQSGGKEFDCPSFLTLHKQGSIFFLDINRENNSAILYRVDADGFTHPLIDIPFVPGGLTLSQDQKHLYISDPTNLKIVVLMLNISLEVTKFETFVELKGLADRLDISTLSDIAEGKSNTLYVGTDNGMIVTSEFGDVLGRIMKTKDVKSISVAPEQDAIYVARRDGAIRLIIH